MYNESVKEEYIKYSKNNVFEEIATKTEQLETLFNKDLYNFSLDEIKELIYEQNFTDLKEIIHFCREIDEYIHWSIEHALSNSNLNPFDIISTEWFKQFLDNRIT